MIHLTKNNRWECLLYSFAMATGITPKQLVKLVGHDGGRSVPGIGHQGFHVQEFIRVCMREGMSVTPLEFCPTSMYTGRETLIAVDMCVWSRFLLGEIRGKTGVITGIGRETGVGHAVAFHKGDIYCPDGGGEKYEFTYDIPHSHQFIPQTAWIVQC